MPAMYHIPGEPTQQIGIPVTLNKTQEFDQFGNAILDANGHPVFRIGFKVGGGIDQDPSKSPQGFPDNGIYVTFVYENGPAWKAGLRANDKILEVNGRDFTMVTHKQAVDVLRKRPHLQLVIFRQRPAWEQQSHEPIGWTPVSSSVGSSWTPQPQQQPTAPAGLDSSPYRQPPGGGGGGGYGAPQQPVDFHPAQQQFRRL